MPSVDTLLDALGQAVIVTDQDGIITRWNTGAEQMYGWKREEVLGRPIIEITPSMSSLEAAERIIETLRVGKSWGGRFRVRHREGYEMEALVILAPLIVDGEMTGIFGISSLLDGVGGYDDLLTPREREIARLTAAGYTSAEIAKQLGITQRTVESHRANVYGKLGIRSRMELVFRAIGSSNEQ